MTSEERIKKEYEGLLQQYLNEAEGIFGCKTRYELRPIGYKDENAPETVFTPADVLYEACTNVWLTNATLIDRKSAIFQLSHEVVHLLSPVTQNEGNEVNYLEEGMAVYFSKHITEREFHDYNFCNDLLIKQPHYYRAYMRYMSLVDIDREAVKKIREVQDIIGSIRHDDFKQVKQNVPDELIDALLEKFDRSNGPVQIT